jgi:hypothetical protein
MLVMSFNWVIACDLIALIGGIVMGVCLVSPRDSETYGRRRW